MCLEEMGRVYWEGPKRCLGVCKGCVGRFEESVWSEEEEWKGETRELEVWGIGETGEGVSWNLKFESLGEMCEVSSHHARVGLK